MGGTYNVVPGVSVGDFTLGDSLWHILDVLRTKKVEYPKIEISWDTENPIKSAITVSLPHINLFFPSSPTQILTLISLPNIPRSSHTLTYEGTVLHSSSSPGTSTSLTRGRVGKVLGPTYAGSSNDRLSYPGISFDLEGNGGRDDLVRGLSVTSRSEETKPLSPLIRCMINPGTGVTLHLPDPLEITIGSTTAQDLLLDLGPPLRKFYKEDNRLERMWGVAATDEEFCFWNYFQYGMDFLADSEGIVIKVICHTTIPGTPLFQRYARCPWEITTTSGKLDYTSSLSSLRSGLTGEKPIEIQGYTTEATLTVPTTEGKGGGKKKKNRGVSPNSTVSSNGSTEKLSETLSPGLAEKTRTGDEGPDKAMVLDRGVEGGLEGVFGLGPSRLVGFDGLVVEEDTDSGGITSLLIFRHDT